MSTNNSSSQKPSIERRQFDTLIIGAGGFLTDINGNELTYGGHDPKFLNPEFIVRSAEIELPSKG